MAKADCFHSTGVDFDHDGIPKWGDATCGYCNGYGWTAELDEEQEQTSVEACDCSLPESDEDGDRLMERLRFVTEILPGPIQYPLH